MPVPSPTLQGAVFVWGFQVEIRLPSRRASANRRCHELPKALLTVCILLTWRIGMARSIATAILLSLNLIFGATAAQEDPCWHSKYIHIYINYIHIHIYIYICYTYIYIYILMYNTQAGMYIYIYICMAYMYVYYTYTHILYYIHT